MSEAMELPGDELGIVENISFSHRTTWYFERVNVGVSARRKRFSSTIQYDRILLNCQTNSTSI